MKLTKDSIKLTKDSIGKVVVPSGKTDIIQFDSEIPGFGLRVHAGGTAVWIFQYRIGKKLQRRMKLGSAKAISALDARKTASKLHARVILGEDVAGQKIEARTKAAETFGAILPLFLTEKKTGLKPRTFEEVERHLLKHAKPLHGLQLTGIARRTVATLLTGLAANNGPNSANSVRASLSSFFSWAMAKGQAENNPVIGTEPANTKGARDRVLDDTELALIWNSLGNDPYGDILRLLALTAARRDEIGALRWSEVNFDEAKISLPPARTKNSRPFCRTSSKRCLITSQATRLASPEPITERFMPRKKPSPSPAGPNTLGLLSVAPAVRSSRSLKGGRGDG
jgi:hypothetical protein